MMANVSRHTMQFSDYAWDDSEALIPLAWRVGLYLEGYAKRYLGRAEVVFGSRVVKAAREKEGWVVQVEGKERREERTFDYVVVSTGYFGDKRIPKGVEGNEEVKVVHSTEYQDLNSLVGERKGGKILIVGGQLSGVEIAATIATNLSSAANSPGPSPITNPEKYTIHHLAERPSWVLPLIISPKVCVAELYVHEAFLMLC
jgi:cation diffusion facilitator CzcD-associated flavoprotein CzcO